MSELTIQPDAGRRWLKALEASMRGEIEPPPVAKTVGFKLVEIREGFTRVELTVDPTRHANPMGTVHGGILVDLGDAAMGMAVASTLADDESFTTLELKANYFKPVWQGLVVAKSTVVKRTRTICYLECEITDEKGSLVSKQSSTCMILRGDMAKGR